MLEKLFALSERNTTVKGEIIAGLTTFITMAYILFLAPNLLSIAGMDKDAVLIATALGGGIVTIAMGLLVNYPICLAPGVGLLAFYTFTVVLGMGVAWQTALGAVFISGIVFLILTLTTVRQHIVEGIPASMKIAITVGIGLFITIIGLKLSGLMAITLCTVNHPRAKLCNSSNLNLSGCLDDGTDSRHRFLRLDRSLPGFHGNRFDAFHLQHR